VDRCLRMYQCAVRPLTRPPRAIPPQYFLWYLCLLPLVVSPQLTNMSPREGLVLFAAWAGSQVRVLVLCRIPLAAMMHGMHPSQSTSTALLVAVGWRHKASTE
jgi:hypothetical protein